MQRRTEALDSGTGSGSDDYDEQDVDVAAIEKMKVTDLRAKLQANGLVTEGKKTDLVARYVAHLVDVTQSIRGSSEASRNKRKRPLEEPDAGLVHEVRTYMKTNKLSQVMVGQEARVSQAVISQWLSLKYHGHNSKVRPARAVWRFILEHMTGMIHGFDRRLARLTPKSCSQVDAAMREWLDSRRAGHVNMPKPDEPTSVLRPSRATTFREKRHKEKKRLKEAARKAEQETDFEEPEAPGLFSLMQLQEAAAVADGSDGLEENAGEGMEGDEQQVDDGQDEQEGQEDEKEDAAEADADEEEAGAQTVDENPRISFGGMAELVAMTLCELESSPMKARKSEIIGEEDKFDPEEAAQEAKHRRLSKDAVQLEGETPPASTEKLQLPSVKESHNTGGTDDPHLQQYSRGVIFSNRKRGVFVDVGGHDTGSLKNVGLSEKLQAIEEGEHDTSGRPSPPISPAPVSPPLLSMSAGASMLQQRPVS
jgi:hypothetical protein